VIIDLPYKGWKPRPYQQPFWDAWQKHDVRRLIEIAHRRWGKDDVCLHGACIKAHERPANYWHAFPEYAQARKGIWTAINPHTGKRRIDEAFPMELRESTNESEMLIKLKVGSTWQVIGSDRYNSLVGAGVAGVVFSEFALANPSAWAYLRPMLEENDGWAAFITTPRGRNHAKSMFDMAQQNPKWFAEISTVHNTGALSPEQLQESLAEYVALYGSDLGRAQFEQEYLCSFNAAILGAFYAREMLDVRNEGRITPIEPLEGKPVHRAWDIGVKDDTSIWWFQVVGLQVLILDCYSSSGAGVDHYAEQIERRRETLGWMDGIDYVPHDGLHPELVPSLSKLDGINAARKTLARCVFDPRCEEFGISALEQYRREWDDDKKTFRANEVHDWCFTKETKIVTRHGMCQISALPKQGEVLTPCGWKQYTNPRITRTSAPLVEVAFKDGLTVKCTPDHMFLTDKGWKSAESLTTGSLIQSCLTPSRSISMAASTAFGQVTNIGRAAAKSCTEMFGLARSVLFQPDATFITETQTPQITTFQTSNAFRQKNTFQKHGVFETSAATSGTARLMTRPAKGLRIGTGLKKVVCGTGGTLSERNLGLSGNAMTGLAIIAQRFSKRLSEKAATLKNTAPKFASPRTIASVKHLDDKQDVWCITVPGEEAFALSNGAVVHNCSHPADAFRYLSIAWRSAPRETEQPKARQQSGTVLLDGPPKPRKRSAMKV